MQRTGQKTLQKYSNSTYQYFVGKKNLDKLPIFYVSVSLLSFISYKVQERQWVIKTVSESWYLWSENLNTAHYEHKKMTFWKSLINKQELDFISREEMFWSQIGSAISNIES